MNDQGDRDDDRFEIHEEGRGSGRRPQHEPEGDASQGGGRPHPPKPREGMEIRREDVDDRSDEL